jgi:Bacterial regulatory protein, Fis family
MSCDITVDDLPGGYRDAVRSRRQSGLERAEREALIAALRAVGWDREAAARDLGISRATIYRKLKRHRIEPPPPHRLDIQPVGGSDTAVPVSRVLDRALLAAEVRIDEAVSLCVPFRPLEIV